MTTIHTPENSKYISEKHLPQLLNNALLYLLEKKPDDPKKGLADFLGLATVQQDLDWVCAAVKEVACGGKPSQPVNATPQMEAVHRSLDALSVLREQPVGSPRSGASSPMLRNRCTSPAAGGSAAVPNLSDKDSAHDVVLDSFRGVVESHNEQDDDVAASVHVIRAAAKVLGADRFSLFVINKGGETLTATINDTKTKLNHQVTIKASEGIIGSAFMKGTPVLIPNAYEDPRFSSAVDRSTNYITKDMLAVPIAIESKPVAVAVLVNKVKGGIFTQEDAATFSVFAEFAGLLLRAGRRNAQFLMQERYQSTMISLCQSLANKSIDTKLLVTEVAASAKNLVGADRCSMFLVDGEELVGHFEGVARTIRMPVTKGIAGKVAMSGVSLIIHDAYADKSFNREIDIQSGYVTRNILCVPVLCENKVVAVAQLVNKLDGQFSPEDEHVLTTFAHMAGICIRNARLIEELMESKKLTQSLLETAQAMFSTDLNDATEINEVVRKHVKNAINQATECQLYVFDPSENLLRNAFVGQGGACTVRELNLSGDEESILNACVRTKKKQVLRSTHAYPVVLDSNSLGVLDITIPEKAHEITSGQEYFVRAVAVYLGVILRNSILYRATLKLNNEMYEVMTRVATTPSDNIMGPTPSSPAHAIDQILSEPVPPKVLDSLKSSDFDVHVFRLQDDPDDPALLAYVISIFENAGVISHFGIDKTTLCRFALSIRSRYKRIPYHNWYHAFDVLQTINTFLHKGKLLTELKPLEVLVLLVVGIVHDVDHMGLNNMFHLKADTPLGIVASATGSRSVLEVHHCQVAIEILSEPKNDFTLALAPMDRSLFFKLMVDCVLATDMARHKDLVGEYTKVTPAFDMTKEAHRQLLMTLLVTSADISNISKPFDIARKWGIAVVDEFYMQGDAERKAALEVTPMFDRERKSELATGQVNFSKFIGIPQFTQLTRLVPNLQYALDSIKENIQHWERVLSATTKH